jgi:hypothetical protein
LLVGLDAEVSTGGGARMIFLSEIDEIGTGSLVGDGDAGARGRRSWISGARIRLGSGARPTAGTRAPL